ncbi:disintegrin and metalloproteinase domain-containing protein 21-like, partial [Equus quagga]|uniref:disintegrin and metalloproteinase domain-containing protein 21-like n=1 Tax=Equus quagga TaxID=89248 RepID=UPI001EE1DB79
MVAGEAEVSMRVVLLLLWHGLSLFPTDLSQAGSSQHLSILEVVIPLKVTNRGRGAKTPVCLSYSLQFGGWRHIVHMKAKKLLVSRHLPVFTYMDQHALQQDQPFVPDDCYYHGYVKGVPESLVALSTCCGGFRGTLHINDLTYEIEPIRHSTTFEHVVYTVNTNETQFPSMRCGLTKKQIAHQQLEFEKAEKSTLKQNSTDNWWTHSWFLELAVVIDHNFFIYSQSNFSRVQEDVFLVVNIVDSIYQQLGTYVILIGTEIWNHGNVFPMVNIEQVLEDFSQWKQISLSQLQDDAAHIFIKNSLIIVLGIDYVAGICHLPIDCG